jgi:hypothetical protein
MLYRRDHPFARLVQLEYFIRLQLDVLRRQHPYELQRSLYIADQLMVLDQVDRGGAGVLEVRWQCDPPA